MTSTKLEKILREAQRCWLGTAEICEILRNHQKFKLSQSPPYRPPAGSLLLFDRNTVKFFRNDGYCWKKKKSGKIGEGHIKLKLYQTNLSESGSPEKNGEDGSVAVLHCFYARGEDNANFRRRVYRMLDEQFKDIVLVHYGEGRKSGIFSHLHVVPVTLGGSSSHSSSVPSSSKTSSPISDVQVSLTSNANEIDQHRASEYENVELQNPSQVYSHAQSTNSSIHHCAPQLAHEATGFSQLLRNPIISSWRSDNYQNVNQLDGFGQQMNKETDGDWDNSLMASNSGNNSNTFDVDNLDMDYLEQLLDIDDDFTLDWTFD